MLWSFFFIGKGNVHVIWNWRNKWIIDAIFRFYFVKKFTILSCVWYHIVIELLNCVWNVFLQVHLVVVRCSEVIVIIRSDHYLCFGCLGLPFLLSTLNRLLCRWKMYSRTQVTILSNLTQYTCFIFPVSKCTEQILLPAGVRGQKSDLS